MLTVYSERSMRESIYKQKLQMIANQMLEVIEGDKANIDQYNGLIMDSCTDPGIGAATYLSRQYEWCQRLDDEVGNGLTNDDRVITITTLADGRRVAHILLEANNESVQIVMKRTYDDWFCY